MLNTAFCEGISWLWAALWHMWKHRNFPAKRAPVSQGQFSRGAGHLEATGSQHSQQLGRRGVALVGKRIWVGNKGSYFRGKREKRCQWEVESSRGWSGRLTENVPKGVRAGCVAKAGRGHAGESLRKKDSQHQGFGVLVVPAC